VLSGIAATVWGYAPNASVHDVMELIRLSGVPLAATPVDFCNGASCPPSTRRVSLCRAVAAVCAGSNYCPSAPTCDLTWDGRDARPTGLSFATPAPKPIGVLGTTWSELTVGTPCDVAIDWTTSAPPEDPCPFGQYYTAYLTPFTHTQPEGTPCPVCLVSSSYTLTMGIAGDAGVLTSPTVSVVFNDLTEKSYALDVDPAELYPGATVEVSNLPFSSSEILKGTISFVVDDKYSSLDQLILE
jgi:hypothetical protein